MPETVNPPVTPPSKGKVFLRRLSSFIFLWVVILGVLFYSNKALADYGFLFIMVLLTGAGLVEFYGMVQKFGPKCYGK